MRELNVSAAPEFLDVVSVRGLSYLLFRIKHKKNNNKSETLTKVIESCKEALVWSGAVVKHFDPQTINVMSRS